MDNLISVKQAAEKLACSERSLSTWMQDKQLQKVEVGRLTRPQKQDIDTIIRIGLQPKTGAHQ